MGKYAPSRKVVAAGLTAVVATVLFVAGQVAVDAVVASWSAVSAAYAVSD